MQAIRPNRLLRGALLADATASGAVAALQLAPIVKLAELLALPSSLLERTGVFLVAYVVLLLLLARSARVWTALVQIVVLGNVAWALGCLGLAFFLPLRPSDLGVAFLVFQAAAVLTFAALEYRGLGQSAGVTRQAVAGA